MDSDTATRRSSRRSGRNSSAKKVLEQIRKNRETGEKVDYEYEKDDAIYDLVDDDEYAQIVQERQEEDFIVDDDGQGYVDDGREIFDDDLNEKAPDNNNSAKGKKSNTKAGGKGNVKSSKITAMFNSTNIKKKKNEAAVTLDGDDVLEDILNSMKTKSADSSTKQKAKSSISNKTPKRLTSSKKTPRRLQDESRTVTLKKTPKMANVFATKVKKEEDNEIEMSDVMDEPVDDQQYNEPASEDSAYGTQKDRSETNIVKTEMDDSGLQVMEGFDDDLKDDEMLLEADDADDNKQDVKENSNETFDKEEWEKMFQKRYTEDPLPNIATTIPSSLPTTTVNGEEVLRFFWLDAYEDRFHQPGTVYLFGKVWIDATKTYVSCCLAVKNIERQIYILPRDTRHSKNGKDLGTPVEFKDVYEEFDQKVSNKFKLMEYKCRKATKKYAFEKFEVPQESDYLEILYSATQPQLPSDLQGETFSHVFGTNTSSLELLFLNQKLQGPSWIDIKYPQLPKQSISWCKVEAVVDRPSFVTVVEETLQPPPLTVLSLSLIATTHSKTHAHEIVSIAGHVQPELCLDKAAPKNPYKYSFCFVTKPSDQLLPYDFQQTIQKMEKGNSQDVDVKNQGFNIQIASNERAMLGLLLAKIQNIDPDVIVEKGTSQGVDVKNQGHDILDFDFDVLLHRLQHNKVPQWSKIGRLKRSQYPKLGGHGKQSFTAFDKNTACGRLVCDVKISSKELIRCQSYDMTKLVEVVLNKERKDMLPEEIPVNMRKKLLHKTLTSKIRKTDLLLNMLKQNMLDSEFKLRMMYDLNIIPLAYQITGICGNVMSRTLLGGRSERNEFLLLHAFSKKKKVLHKTLTSKIRGYILPDKSYNLKKQQVEESEEGGSGAGGKKRKGRKKPAYTGGLVLEPKKGFYDKYILLLDFNSLYPSIIQEYNICFTTIAREIKPKVTEGEEEEEELPKVPDSDLEAGILPTEIRRLVERRKTVKGLLKKTPPTSEMYLQYDIRQKALKLTANSMYGCLGFSHSRFYAKPLAALVTGKGREILLKTKDLAGSLGLDVIYGDTDSIMINTNCEDLQEVRKIGTKVKNEVNKLYKMVEIDIDGIFKSMLLLKKKKYAAVTVNVRDDGTISTSTEMKGLDIVRRDWCDLAKDAGKYVLDQILSTSQRDMILENIHDYLRTVREQLQDGGVALQKFEIHKSLTKNPDEYPDKKSQPHVTVAQRLMSQGRRVAVGDTINYVICDDASKLPASQRAYHPDELMKNKNLKIDNHYYLSSQIHPVVSRLCDPIDGTDAAFLASCLGLDPSSYKSARVQEDTVENSLTILMTDEERFKHVEKFFVRCYTPTCSEFKKEIEFKGIADEKAYPLECGKCKAIYDLKKIQNSLTIIIRSHISKYYKAWLQCDDPACGYTSRHISVKNFKNAQICQHCNKGHLQLDYKDSDLYNQMLYLSRLFDIKKLPSNVNKGDNKDWLALYKHVEKSLKFNAYSIVSIADLLK